MTSAPESPDTPFQCLECGKFLTMLSSIHLKQCSGITYREYLISHPRAPTMTSEVKARRAKTPAQREAQSQKLKARFQSPEGEITRNQISEASKRMQASESGERSKNYLRKLNADPVRRAQISVEMKAWWTTPEAREKVVGWHRDHKDESNRLAAEARKHNKRKRTKFHLGFKDLMTISGVVGFVTEYEIGYYSIDEANPDLKIALELDGCYWHSCSECGLKGPEGTLRIDRSKTSYLENRGWVVLHLWEHEVKTDPQGCIERVRQLVLARMQSVNGMPITFL